MIGNKSHSQDMVLIVDNFIKDPELLEAINNDPYWKQDQQPSTWYERYTAPRNPLEKYVNQVYHEMFPSIITPEITGFEYWGWNVFAGDNGIPIHLDHDEYQQWSEGTVLTPRYLTIFYSDVSDDIEGGELYLYNKHHFADTTFFDQTDTPVHERDKTPLGEPTILYPRKNRLIIAPGCYYHEVKPVTKGFRRSLNCNPWEKPEDGRDDITFDYEDFRQNIGR
ncbi:MAG: 2OG-Fe(II) oxygenase [Neptunomonas phycophila]|uniref:2OG-Fe(II) oxygenase n=1 Tax=Neptunomonas phycophila TaxID=1572645 RepID=UPI003B8E3A02